MKKNYFMILLAGVLFSCSNENNVTTVDVDKSETSDEKTEYYKYISELENEFVDIPVYHFFNKPDYGDEIALLEENSIPLPKELTNKNIQSRAVIGEIFTPYGPWGGSGGLSNFEIKLPGETWRLSAIKFRCADLIDAVQLYWNNNEGRSYYSPMVGGSKGYEQWFFLQNGEYIKGIRMKYGQFVDNITFITNRGVYSYGGSGGKRPTEMNLNLPTGYQIHGVFGRSGSLIDKIGFYSYSDKILK